MRKIISLFAVLTVCVFSLMPIKAKASHGGGGELIYEWISDSTYRFFFKFYRDCTGIPAGGPWSLCAVPTCTPTNPNVSSFSTSMNAWTGNLPGGGQNGSPLSSGCAGAQYQTKCTNASSIVPGFEEWWYSAIVTLPGQCNFWTFNVSVSARNISNNITGASGNLYLETTFNNLFFQGNSSPYFSIKPIPYVCVNSPFSYNNGAIDPDGDSLVTDMVTPRYDAGSCPPTASNCGMFSGFSLPSNPMPTGNTFTLNPQTGQLNFTATQTGPHTLTTRVREYRQHFLIGYIMRDVQVQVMNCSSIVPNVAPVGSTVNGGNYSNSRVNGCVNQPLNFCYDIKSPDPTAILKVDDNHVQSIPAAVITYSAQAKDSIRGCFSWTPGIKDTGLKGFIVTVKDSTCRPPGIMLYYPITVPIYIWAPTRAFRDTSVCPGQTAFLAVVGGANFQWSVLPGGSPITSLNNPNIYNPVATPYTTTTYVATSTINPYCGNTTKDTVTVSVLAAPQFTHHADTVTCPHNPVKLDLKPTPPSGITYTYKWKTLPVSSTTYLNNDTISNPISNPSADVKYTVTLGTSASNCKDYDTILVDVLDGFLIENIDTAVCDGESVKVRATGDPRYSFVWLTDPLSGATLSAPNALVTDIKQGNIGKYAYTLKASFPNCTDSISAFNIETQPIPTVSVDDDAKVCFGDTMKLHGMVKPTTYPYSLKWTPGAALDKDDIPGPIFSASQAGVQTLSFKAFSSAGCADSDQVVLTVFPADFLTVSTDTAICSGDSIQLHLTAIGVKSFKWVPDINISNKTGLDPYVWPAATQAYRIYGLDTNGCLDTAMTKITVKPAARIDIPDTVRLYPGESYHMQPGGNALYYNWFPPLGLNKTNISNPIMRPDVNTRYFVNARTEEGCSISGTVDVIVIPDSYIDVPNAFSPGGPNGTLKPVHLGNATLKSFAVYNRWGVKMFETKDLNTGWDGKYNGEPQPMGVYIYSVEAVTPSGKTFTKQGDVTLFR
jgi:gliding motility-associated-like protein